VRAVVTGLAILAPLPFPTEIAISCKIFFRQNRSWFQGVD
jgi:hypothetical protein